MAISSIAHGEMVSWMKAVPWFRQADPRAVSAIARVLQGGLDGCGRLLLAVMRRDFCKGLALAGAGGYGVGRARLLGPSCSEIRSLLGDLSLFRCRRIGAAMAASAAKNLVLRNVVGETGMEGLDPVLCCHGFGILKVLHQRGVPVIFIFGHNGPIQAIVSSLRRCPYPLLVLKRAAAPPERVPENVRYCVMDDVEAGGVVMLKTAVAHLRRRGAVLMALWPLDLGKAIPAVFFGRPMAFNRGFAAAARITGAAVVPVFSSWRKDGRIDVEIFPPLSSSGYRSEDGHSQESALMAQASGWLEERIRMFPGQVQIDQLRAMVSRLSAESETPRR